MIGTGMIEDGEMVVATIAAGDLPGMVGVTAVVAGPISPRL